MQNIETMAYNSTKMKKDDVQAFIKNLYDTASDDIKKDLAAIYKYFTPSMPKVTKCPLMWVYKAVSKEAAREYLNHSYSDGTHLIATDGYRLHYIKTDLEKGFYDSKGVQIDFEGNFPDFERIVPEAKHSQEVDFSKLELKTSERGKKIIQYVLPLNGKEHLFDKKIVDEALNGQTKVTIWGDFDSTSSCKGFDLEFGKALVIPMRP